MTTVRTPHGLVKGKTDGQVLSFLGVPYAAPITRANRFLAPQPVQAWAGVRDATALGPVCPQLPTYGPVGTAATSELTQGSDFLTLNIRTPSLDGRAPVLVWIHGGGYAVGSANEPVLQSGAFAASGIVEVTVNYRLGASGFLHVPGRPDNRGLLDQIAALTWVRDTIAVFGGDPARVTFAGRSAGGFAIAAVMAMPGALGLFSRAMPQSGASTAVSDRPDAAKLTARMMVRLGLKEPRFEDVPLGDLLLAQRDLCNESYERHDFDRDGAAAMLGVPFVPVIDGVSLPEHPETAAAAGRTAPVPMMIGCTTAEYLTHSSVLPGQLDVADVARLVHQRVRPLGFSGADIVSRYRAALPAHSAHGLWRAICGDLVFQNPTTRFARLHGASHRVQKYLYGPLGPDEAGIAHGGEVGNVWFRPGADSTALPARQQPDENGFAASVHDLWASFIHGAAAPADWPHHGPADLRILHIAPGAIRSDADPFGDRPALWADPPHTQRKEP